MRIVKNYYIIVSLLVLMIVRVFAKGGWFGTIVVISFLIPWIEITNLIIKIGNNLKSEREKKRYALVLAFMFIVGTICFILAIVNIVINISWLNRPIILDELTLITLLICLCQSAGVNIANSFIKYKRGATRDGKNF